jgi:hypothetical protein
MRTAFVPFSFACVALLLGCSSSSSSSAPPTPATIDGGSDTCSGDPSKCLHGTVVARGFNVPYADAKVQVYTVYPYGNAKPAIESASTREGKFAFDGLDPGETYYLQALAKFKSSAGTFAVASVVGPLTVPSASALELHVRPVFLEALEQRPAGGQLALSWASAHVYDPNTAKDLEGASVTLKVAGGAYPMPLGTNLSGQPSYFVDLSKLGLPAATQLAIDVAHPAFASGTTFNLVAAPPDFDPQVTSPAEAAEIAVGHPITVAWKSEPRAAYALLQFFRKETGGAFAVRYASDAPRPHTVTNETIPATAVDGAGAYLLNVQMARPTCPKEADGCVYNASTAAVDVDAK